MGQCCEKLVLTPVGPAVIWLRLAAVRSRPGWCRQPITTPLCIRSNSFRKRLPKSNRPDPAGAYSRSASDPKSTQFPRLDLSRLRRLNEGFKTPSEMEQAYDYALRLRRTRPRARRALEPAKRTACELPTQSASWNRDPAPLDPAGHGSICRNARAEIRRRLGRGAKARRFPQFPSLHGRHSPVPHIQRLSRVNGRAR